MPCRGAASLCSWEVIIAQCGQTEHARVTGSGERRPGSGARQEQGSHLSSASACGMWSHEPPLNLRFFTCIRKNGNTLWCCLENK